MGVFDDLVAKARALGDRNGDGKLNEHDWDELTKDLDTGTKEKVTAFKDAMDTDDNGRYDLNDLQKGFGDLKDRFLGGK